MTNFKDISSSHSTEQRYVNKRFVYLESEEDVQIYGERWFNNVGDKLEFVSAGVGASGGCTVVIADVERELGQGVDAYGIVDRDALKSCGKWDAFFEVDNTTFDALKPFGDRIIVLRRWEMENYLLEPEIIEKHVSNVEGRAPRALQQVMGELFEMSALVRVICGANICLNRSGYCELPAGFGRGHELQRVEQEVLTNLHNQFGDNAEALYQNELDLIDQFSVSSDEQSEERWCDLIRMIDGKRLLNHLVAKKRLKDEPRFTLAHLIRVEGRLPPELVGIIDELCGSTPYH